MVSIRRPQQQQQQQHQQHNHGGGGGASFRPGQRTTTTTTLIRTICSCRTILLCFIVVQSLNIMIKLIQKTSPILLMDQHQPNNNNNNNNSGNNKLPKQESTSSSLSKNNNHIVDQLRKTTAITNEQHEKHQHHQHHTDNHHHKHHHHDTKDKTTTNGEEHDQKQQQQPDKRVVDLNDHSHWHIPEGNEHHVHSRDDHDHQHHHHEQQPSKNAMKSLEDTANEHQELPDRNKPPKTVLHEQQEESFESLYDHNNNSVDTTTTANTLQQERLMIHKYGTGPAKLGYVIDLVQEENNVPFRYHDIDQKKDIVDIKIKEHVSRIKNRFVSLLKNDIRSSHTKLSESIQSCETIRNRIQYHRSECLGGIHEEENNNSNKGTSTTGTLYVYNAAPFPRVVPCHINGQIQSTNTKSFILQPGQYTTLTKGIHYVDESDQYLCFNQPAKYYYQTEYEQPPDIIITSHNYQHIGTEEELQNMEPNVYHSLQSLEQCDNIPCRFTPDIFGKNGNAFHQLIAPPVLVSKQVVSQQKEERLHVLGTNWTMIRSIADPYYQTGIKMERTAYKNDVYYSTTSFRSSIPLSYYRSDTYDYFTKTSDSYLLMKKNQRKFHEFTTTKATYIQSVDCTGFRKNKWYAAVKVVLPIDSYGKCEHNIDVPDGSTIETIEGRVQLYSQNKITLIFESGNEKDYVTSQIWEALLAGSIPAILGSSNVDQHLPKHPLYPTAIYASNFNNWDKFAEYIHSVASNETLWEQYMAWKKGEDPQYERFIQEQFQSKYNFTNVSPNCRLCKWIYSKKYGLSWNHQQQSIQENPFITRQLCTTTTPLTESTTGTYKTNDSRMIIHPFIESWSDPDSEIMKVRRTRKMKNEATTDCHKSFTMSESETIHVQDTETTSVKRRIYYHDGVTDMYIDEMKSNENDDDQSDSDMVALRLQFNVRNAGGAAFRNTHTTTLFESSSSTRSALVSSLSIVDEISKVTVLVNSEHVTIHSPMEGIIELIIPSHITKATTIKEEENDLQQQQKSSSSSFIRSKLRIRVIIEDFHEIQDKVTEYHPSYFGKNMMMDFIDPLEFFYHSSASSTTTSF